MFGGHVGCPNREYLLGATTPRDRILDPLAGEGGQAKRFVLLESAKWSSGDERKYCLLMSFEEYDAHSRI